MKLLAALIVLSLVAWCLVVAHDGICPTCLRRWAIFPVTGRLRRRTFVCRACYRAHERRLSA